MTIYHSTTASEFSLNNPDELDVLLHCITSQYLKNSQSILEFQVASVHAMTSAVNIYSCENSFTFIIAVQIFLILAVKKGSSVLHMAAPRKNRLFENLLPSKPKFLPAGFTFDWASSRSKPEGSPSGSGVSEENCRSLEPDQGQNSGEQKSVSESNPSSSICLPCQRGDDSNNAVNPKNRLAFSSQNLASILKAGPSQSFEGKGKSLQKK